MAFIQVSFLWNKNNIVLLLRKKETQIHRLNMKKYCAVFLLAIISAVVMAIPARRGQWKTLRLTDGTTVRAELRGDEQASYYQSKSGEKYVQDAATGLFKVADMQQLKAKVEARKAVTRRMRTMRRARTRAPFTSVEPLRKYIGSKKVLLILVQFKDAAFQTGHDKALYERIFNEEGFSQDRFKGSVKDYFKSQSNGQFAFDFDVAGPVTLTNNVTFYGGKDANGNDENPGAMVVEACKAVDGQVNFANYDWDGDGEVEQIFLVYAGLGQANGGENETIWPHEWDVESATYDPATGNHTTLKLDQKIISTYACSAELQPEGDYDLFGDFVMTGTTIDGIGTTCHELTHCLDFPDMYDTTDGNANFGMGTWDIMDYGGYNDDGFQPSAYTSYERMMAGWLTPKVLSADTVVTSMKSLSEKDAEAFIIYNDSVRSEYYLLENRQQKGWDAAQPGAGLLVLHVDYDRQVWEDNTVNNDANRQRCTLIHADNSEFDQGDLTDEELAGDAFPYVNADSTVVNDSLTNNSRPAARFYNANKDGKKYLNKGIHAIRQNADSTIAFNFKSISVRHSTLAPGDTVFYESFNKCNGTGGNDNRWSGSVAASTKAFSADMDGWTALGSIYGGNACARFGTSKLSGQAISPEFTLDDDAELKFRIAPWGTDGNSVDVAVNGKTVGSFTMQQGKWSEFTVEISGSGTTQITFSGSKRFFLDDVLVCAPEATPTAIERVKGHKQGAVATGRIYNLSGQYVGMRLEDLPHGIYIRDGKKVIK